VKAKLLLADDSVTIQRVIELTFADENVQVVAVGDGKEAIERVQTERPDIVLADIGMPERDGYEVAAFIKGNPEFAHIPVLLLTGAFEPVDEVRAKSVGCEGVLVKPFEPQMVISRVRELLGKRAPEPQAAPPVPADAASTPPPLQESAQPAAPANRESKPDPLEDYFDRLDAALSTVNTPPPPLERVVTPLPEYEHVPESPRGHPGAAPGVVHQTQAAVSPVEAPSSFSVAPPLHEAFAALLAAERGQPLHPTGPTREAITEDVIEEVVRRVMARMGSDSMRHAVLDSAERLVREEIERIKKS
jgi:CheY-like chemotaxis protein